MQNKELREHKRHELENVFVVCKQIVCRIFDLSNSGASFGWTDEVELPENLTLKITDNKGIELFDLPVQVIREMTNEDSDTSSIYKKVVSVKFRDSLTPQQQGTLRELLD